MKKIEILGPGCARCKKTEEEIRRALTSIGWQEGHEFVIEKVVRPTEIAARGVLMTPGVILDGKIVSTGKIPTHGEIVSWIEKAEQ